jgi:hypothetical protein
VIEAKAAEVEPFPAQVFVKGVLRRTVQIAKRHRDICFAELDPSLAPISVIITTLAARSYEWCVGTRVYISEFDVLVDTLRHMPEFIEQRRVAGRSQWYLWNETTQGENFAEKWNIHPERAEAFFHWHGQVCADIEQLIEIEGLDQITKSLSESFGSVPVSRAINTLTEQVNTARAENTLSVAPGIGLSIGTGLGTRIRSNKFYGAR